MTGNSESGWLGSFIGGSAHRWDAAPGHPIDLAKVTSDILVSSSPKTGVCGAGGGGVGSGARHASTANVAIALHNGLACAAWFVRVWFGCNIALWGSGLVNTRERAQGFRDRTAPVNLLESPTNTSVVTRQSR